MNRNSKPRIFAVLIPAVAALALFLSGCKDFSFFSELGIKGGLSISPSAVTVDVDASVTFTATGGNPPYTYGIASGTGSIVAATGVYTAPSAAGYDIVVVTDSTGQSGTASVTVVSSLEALKISPTTASVSVGNSISFVATGGVGPYTFDFQTNNSGGNITSGGVYTAGSTTGVSDTIIVTDSDTPAQTCSVPAVVSVTTAVTNVDYNISGDTFPASGLVATSISGNFTIHNGGIATGTANISWWLFISEDGTFGGMGEHLVDSGTVTDDIPASGDYVVAPTGNWPSDLSQGNYDLFVMASSPDDLNHTNNVSAASPFTLSVPDVDYRVLSVANMGGTRVGGSISGQFMLDNEGTDDGTQTVTWKAYVSSNTTIDVGDTLIDTGTEGAMTSAEAPRTVSFGGTWPSSPGSYYLVVEVIAGEDTAAGTDGDNTTATGSALSVAYPDVDYQVVSVSHTSGTGAGGAVDGEFDLDNIGSDDGTASVDWKVYASTNTSVDIGDALIASGTTTAMTVAEAPRTIGFSGTWPTNPGSYYLVVEIESTEDVAAGNDGNDVTATGAAIAVTVADIDYYADAISSVGGLAGDTLSCSFDLNNAGSDAGGATVTWKLYVSANTTLDAGDYLAAWGTEGPLGAVPSSTTVSPSGTTWPMTPGDYYLIVEIESTEDVAAGNDGNDVAVSGSTFSVAYPDVDYLVLSVSHLAGTAAGGAVDGEFDLDNIGSDDGTATVDWKVYASNNTSVDVGDELIASGTSGAMTVAEAPRTIGFSGTWPTDPGSYYLVVEVTSFDDTQAANFLNNTTATGAAIAIALADIDYYADAISSTGGLAGAALSCSFDLNNAGSDAGGTTVTWNLYVSANTALDAGDYLATWGTAGPLGAVPSSTTVSPSGATWPMIQGDYYLIVEIESTEDVAAGNDGNDVAVSASTFTVAAPNVDYIVDQVIFVPAGSTYLPDGAVNGNFVYKNNGTNNGTQPVSWEAYASLDGSLDAGDVLIQSGSGLPPLGVGGTSGSIPFSGKWPLDFGKYFLLVRVMSSDELNPTDNAGATVATEAVGYFDESLNEPNDDYLTLTDFYDLGVTFKPGMSIEITGTMSSSDMDDIMAFNTGTSSMITFAITYSSAKAQIRIFLMDGPNTFIDGVSGTPGAISLNWTVDTAGVQRYLNLDNRGAAPPWDGPYTCVITGH